MGHKQLTYINRCHIMGLWKAGFNQTQIAKEVGVHRSTISREFKRNMTLVYTKFGSWQYKPNYAQAYADERRKSKRYYYKFTQEVTDFCREKLLQDWSPEQISGYAKRWKLFSISHERIYQFILKDKEQGGQLYKHLRHQHKRYRKRYGSPKRQCSIKDRIMIDERPKIVNERTRTGDWEIDTIIGKNQKQAILSIVDRCSKFTLLRKLSRKNSELTRKLLTEALKPFENSVHTITSENGSEFTSHKEVSEALDADFYFAHPYSSWERGLNENTNGLVRQYIKKGSVLTGVTDKDLAIIECNLNSRPRKTLGYQTPSDIFNADIGKYHTDFKTASG